MANAALVTSTFTHPYTVTVTSTGSPKTKNLAGVALLRHDDTVSCAQHGTRKIVGTAAKARDLDTKIFAKVGDVVEDPCGAIIATGDPDIQLS